MGFRASSTLASRTSKCLKVWGKAVVTDTRKDLAGWVRHPEQFLTCCLQMFEAIVP